MSNIIEFPLHTTKLMNMRLNLGSFQLGLEQVIDLALKRQGGYACFANVHMTITALNDDALRNATNEADFVFTDGKPLCLALRLTQKVNQERIAGMDFMPRLLEIAAHQQLSVYFLGGSKDINAAVVETAMQKFPNLCIVGAESPPFRALTENESLEMISRINSSGAHLLFVALGCPKQEVWMHKHRHQLKAFQLGVGGAFPVFAGFEHRAPVWAQKLSLEWLYRLLQDPKRLWKRYLLTNSYFMFLLLGLLVKQFLAYCIPYVSQQPSTD